MGCNAFISTPLEIKGAALANVFHEVKVNLVSAEAERICIDRMVKGQENAFSTPDGLADVDSRMASLVRCCCCCFASWWSCGNDRVVWLGTAVVMVVC